MRPCVLLMFMTKGLVAFARIIPCSYTRATYMYEAMPSYLICAMLACFPPIPIPEGDSAYMRQRATFLLDLYWRECAEEASARHVPALKMVSVIYFMSFTLVYGLRVKFIARFCSHSRHKTTYFLHIQSTTAVS